MQAEAGEAISYVHADKSRMFSANNPLSAYQFQASGSGKPHNERIAQVASEHTPATRQTLYLRDRGGNDCCR